MKMPDAFWRMTYAADRRKHRHRCCCGCNIIVQPGEAVFMAKTAQRRLAAQTRVLRADHAERASDGFTALDHLEAWGMAHLAACGWPEAIRFTQTDPIFRVGGKKAHRAEGNA